MIVDCRKCKYGQLVTWLGRICGKVNTPIEFPRCDESKCGLRGLMFEAKETKKEGVKKC